MSEPTALCACDVLVIGGGPAGSTAATLLAGKGYRVVLLEKARHPRFHIGESLLPANLPMFERLGVADEMRRIGMEKWGAEFVSPWHAHRQVFQFGDAWDKSITSPTMRELFMGPRNILRMKEALLSLLAGDIFGKTPIWRSLLAFKVLYYASSVLNFRRSFAAWRRRRVNIRSVDAGGLQSDEQV